jgi:hypothetical protein
VKILVKIASLVVVVDGDLVCIEGLKFGDSISIAGCENGRKTWVVLCPQIGFAIFV